MWQLRNTARQRLVWLTLLMLFSVNTVLVWHGVAHVRAPQAIQHSTGSDLTAPLDFHCDLCLSGHGLTPGTLEQFATATSYVLLLPVIAIWLVTVLAPTFHRPKARASPL